VTVRQFDSVEDARASLRQHALDVATSHHRYDRAVSPEVAEANALDDAARELAARSTPFATAWGALVSGAWIVPLGPDGPLPGMEPTRDVATLVAYWEAHPDAVAGTPCGEQFSVLAAILDDDGWDRLRATAALPPALDPDPDDHGRPPAHRDPLGAPLVLHEVHPATPNRQLSYFGTRGERAAGEALKTPMVQTRRLALCWAWPHGSWEFPIGKRIARGTWLPTAVPLTGSTIELDGRRWHVQCELPGRWPTCPAWVAEEILSGKQQVAA
jgi:hypothetical protein